MRAHITALTSLRAIRRNPMRSMLTTLGIVIGVAAVIAMMEIGKGSATAIRKTIESMGGDTLLVRAGAASAGGVSFGGGSAVSLTPYDCEAIVRECPAVRAATPIVWNWMQAIYGGRNWSVRFQGVGASYFKVMNWPLAEGGIFDDNDVQNLATVCVVGQTIVRELFLGESPLGKEIRVKEVPFRVLGVLQPKGANMWGDDMDDIILAPWSTVKYRLSGSSSGSSRGSSSDAVSTTVNTISQTYPGGKIKLYPDQSSVQLADSKMFARFSTVDAVSVAALSPERKPQLRKEITELLRERHRLREADVDDFKIRDMSEISDALASTNTLMTKLLFGVALISLVVGGVGIMNIMLVSVTERTREIGLRMAVGARSGDILRQFLTEAVILCLFGGAIGIVLGHGGSHLVKIFLHWPVETSLPAIAIAVAVSAGVGIAFGYYPAWKASRLDPIEALRYE